MTRKERNKLRAGVTPAKTRKKIRGHKMSKFQEKHLGGKVGPNSPWYPYYSNLREAL